MTHLGSTYKHARRWSQGVVSPKDNEQLLQSTIIDLKLEIGEAETELSECTRGCRCAFSYGDTGGCRRAHTPNVAGPLE